ncbi:MAG: hypothetical protein RMY28_021960 [Nostoc sp. ChiSLP01]|nr:hypothetical protein [Nostoc sp. CmiSLP01]MDZ8284442.1 hypothetical protein [Nostoc sp. ChiSLP01]
MAKTTPTTVKNDKTGSNCEERLGQLRQELNKIFLERSTVIDGVLAVLLTNSNAVLFGPPGCAKSWPDCVWKKEPKERQKIAQILNQVIPDVNQQAVNWYDAAKEEVKKVQLAAKEYDLRPRNDTEKNLIETADSAAKHLEDVSRQIEKLLSQNQGKNVRRAKRMLTDIREDLMLEVAKYKEKVYS